jgi:hypothetical protein
MTTAQLRSNPERKRKTKNKRGQIKRNKNKIVNKL